MEQLSNWDNIKYHLFYRREIQVKYTVLPLYTSVLFNHFLLSTVIIGQCIWPASLSPFWPFKLVIEQEKTSHYYPHIRQFLSHTCSNNQISVLVKITWELLTARFRYETLVLHTDVPDTEMWKWWLFIYLYSTYFRICKIFTIC